MGWEFLGIILAVCAVLCAVFIAAQAVVFYMVYKRIL